VNDNVQYNAIFGTLFLELSIKFTRYFVLFVSWLLEELQWCRVFDRRLITGFTDSTRTNVTYAMIGSSSGNPCGSTSTFSEGIRTKGQGGTGTG